MIFHQTIKTDEGCMASNKRVFTLRLDDEAFEKIGALATAEHRSMTNYIEYVLLKHIQEIESDRPDESLLKHKDSDQ